MKREPPTCHILNDLKYYYHNFEQILVISRHVRKRVKRMLVHLMIAVKLGGVIKVDLVLKEYNIYKSRQA